MGDVHVRISVANPRASTRAFDITAIADTGATLSLIPAALLDDLRIERVRSATLVLADGQEVSRDIGEAVITIDQDSATCRVVFGAPGDAALLGVTALELLGLAVDPVQRRLVPTKYLLYTAS